jgi:hypothetical protein
VVYSLLAEARKKHTPVTAKQQRPLSGSWLTHVAQGTFGSNQAPAAGLQHSSSAARPRYAAAGLASSSALRNSCGGGGGPSAISGYRHGHRPRSLAETTDELVELARDIAARGDHRLHARLVFGSEGQHYLLAQLGVDIFLGKVGEELIR